MLHLLKNVMIIEGYRDLLYTTVLQYKSRCLNHAKVIWSYLHFGLYHWRQGLHQLEDVTQVKATTTYVPHLHWVQGCVMLGKNKMRSFGTHHWELHVENENAKTRGQDLKWHQIGATARRKLGPTFEVACCN